MWNARIDRGIKVHRMVAYSLGDTAVASAPPRSLMRKHINAPAPWVGLISPPASLIRYSKMFARYVGISERIATCVSGGLSNVKVFGSRDSSCPLRGRRPCSRSVYPRQKSDCKTKYYGTFALALAWPDARLVAIDKLTHRRILRDAKAIKHTID